MPFGGLLTAGVGLAGAAAPFFSGGSDRESAPLGPTNPGFNVLQDIFGSTFLNGRNLRGIFNDAGNPGIFGGDFKAQLQDLLSNAPGLFGAEEALGADFLGGGEPLEQLRSAQEQIGQLIGRTNELVDTGFVTSAQPAFEEAERRFSQNILPQIAEVAGAQTGLSSTGFIDPATRASADLLGNAALQQIGLNEAAAGRRAGALPLLGSQITTQLGLQPAFVNDLLALGGGLRNVRSSQQTRPLQTFLALNNAGQGQTFLQPGFNPQGSGLAQLTQGLSGALPGFIQAATSFGGGGGAAPTVSSATGVPFLNTPPFRFNVPGGV